MPRRGGDRLRLLRDGDASRASSRGASCRSRRTPRGESRALCGNAFDVLIDLHAVDVAAVPALAALGRGEGYVDRQVAGWIEPARAGRTPTTSATVEPVTAWLDEHQPDDVGQLPDPQRLPLRQPGPRRRRPAAGQRRARLGDGHRRRPADGPRRGDGLLGPGRRRRVLPACSAASRHQPAGHAGLARRDRRALLRAHRAARSPPEQWRFYEVFGLFRLARDRPADLLPLLPRPDPQRGLRRASARPSATSSSAAAGLLGGSDVGQVLLVRHGQASWGADDYDVLSETWAGRSAGLLGACAGLRRDRPRRWCCAAAMRRHRETAEALLDGGGWDAPAEVDAGWDEFDHLGVVARYPDLPEAVADRGPPGVPAALRAGHRPLDRRRARRRLPRVVLVVRGAGRRGAGPGRATARGRWW